MGGKAAIALGLVAGLAVGGLMVGGVIALVPASGLAGPTADPAPAATDAPATDSPTGSPGAILEDGGSPAITPAITPAVTPPTTPGGSPPATSASPAAAGGFSIGQPAPALVLPAVGGGTVDLASLRGKPVWVDFIATSCAPCQDELPLMQGFATRYEKAGLATLLVDVKEDEATVKAYLDDLNVYLPASVDTDGAAQAAWAATALPVHFWIDKDGIVRQWALGGIGSDTMAEGLQTILPDEIVTP